MNSTLSDSLRRDISVFNFLSDRSVHERHDIPPVKNVDLYDDGIRTDTQKELAYTEIIADLVVMVKYLDKKVRMLEGS